MDQYALWGTIHNIDDAIDWVNLILRDAKEAERDNLLDVDSLLNDAKQKLQQYIEPIPSEEG